jgi:hypothetical protein
MEKKQILKWGLVILLLGMILVSYDVGCGKGDGGKGVNNAVAISAAKTVVLEKLKTPATAQWVSEEIMEQSGNYYLVFLEVDAQNLSGALVRNSFIVIVETIPGSTKFSYIPAAAVVECNRRDFENKNDTDFKSIIEGFKSLNKWPGTTHESNGGNNEQPAQVQAAEYENINVETLDYQASPRTCFDKKVKFTAKLGKTRSRTLCDGYITFYINHPLVLSVTTIIDGVIKEGHPQLDTIRNGEGKTFVFYGTLRLMDHMNYRGQQEKMDLFVVDQIK